MIGVGLSLSPVAVRGRPPDADAAAYFARAGALTEARKALINTFVVGLKVDFGIANLSDRFDAIYLLANETSTAALANVVKNAHNAGVVNAPTFTPDRGYTGIIASSTAITTNAALNAMTRFAQNSAHFSVYNRTSRTSSGGVTRALCGARGAAGVSGSRLIPYVAADSTARCALNQGATDTRASDTNAQGFHVVSRISSAEFTWRRNSALFATIAETSQAPTSRAMHLLDSNEDGVASSFTDDQIAAATLGSGLTAGEEAFLRVRLEAYLDAIGAGVL